MIFVFIKKLYWKLTMPTIHPKPPFIPKESPDNPYNLPKNGAPIFDGNEIGIAMLVHVIGALFYFLEKIGVVLKIQREIHKA